MYDNYPTRIWGSYGIVSIQAGAEVKNIFYGDRARSLHLMHLNVRFVRFWLKFCSNLISANNKSIYHWGIVFWKKLVWNIAGLSFSLVFWGPSILLVSILFSRRILGIVLGRHDRILMIFTNVYIHPNWLFLYCYMLIREHKRRNTEW